MRLFRKKEKTGRSHLADSAGYFHLHDDCPAVSGDVKRVYGADFLKYNLCPECSRRHTNIIRENASDLQKNEGKYMTEFLDNVRKSELADDEKLDVARRGLVAIRMQTFIWSTLEDMEKEK